MSKESNFVDLLNKEMCELKISDLEAKLAESEKERELDNSFWKQECDSLQKTLAEKDAELWKWSTQYAGAYVHRQNALIAEKVGLQQQLVEKENTITTLIEDSKTSKELLKKQLTDKEQENERLKEEICKYEITLMDKNSQLKKQQQDKISFTIEQLEKAKEFFLEEHRDEEMDTDYIITKDAGEIADYILDQINELKGKVEDVKD